MNDVFLTPGAWPTGLESFGRKPRNAAEAARQFEALLIQHLLQTMREAGRSEDKKDEASGDDTYLEIAEQAMAQALVQRGGLGLARLIERGLAPRPPAGSRAIGSGGSADKKTEGNTGR
jgi:Rod binding domain-containing protein